MKTMKTRYLNKISFLAIISLLMLAPTAHAEGGGWWPGGDKKAEAPPTSSTPVDGDTMVDAPLFKLSWPKVEMPKFAWKQENGTAPRSLTDAQGNPISRALDKVATSSKNASNKVRGAWDSAVSKLPFTGDGATRSAKKDQPGFWTRLMTPLPEEETGSETVQQFLAQDRVGTTR